VPHTLLLADDSVTIQRVIELTFADEDVHVLTVGDGDQAIAAIDQKPPDIVLADIGMPGRDGYEVAQHVKKTPRLAHIPVLLLTGAFEPIDQVRASAVGCDGVLAKPFEPQLVIGRVRELLARQPTVPVAAAPAAAAPSVAEPPLDELSSAPRPHRLVNDQYFDELDQAFATLTASAQRRRERSAETQADEAIGWFSRTVSPAPPPPEKSPAAEDAALDAWTVPVPKPATAPPQPATPAAAASAPSVPPAASSTPAAAPAASGQSAAAASAPVPPPVAAFPKLADAFAALLAAEQTSPPAAAAPIWPSPATAAVSPEVVEHATRRILHEMSQTAVRDIVTEVAERLVREEIERIRKTIT
jgi:CheY-like chemotaxis protein